MPGQPKFTRTVSVSVQVSPIEPTVKDWNRDFEKGDLSEWTALDAEISEVEPYEGDYCCKLLDTDSSITQTLDDPMPVNGVWMLRFRARSAAGNKALKPIIHYTDGTTSEGGFTVFGTAWRDVHMLRGDMKAGKILSGIGVESAAGEIYIDDVELGLATEIVTGAVEASQITPLNLQAEAVARPKGFDMDAYPKKGSETTTDTYATVVEYVVPNLYKYMLTKILVSCPEDVMYRIRFGGTVKSAEVYVTGGIPFTDWFPWGWAKMWGDDVKTIDIQVKYPSGGAAATCHAELVGEYVPRAFNL